MEQAPKALKLWLDADFFKRGAFLTSTDGDVYFGKGGEITVRNDFLNSRTPVFYLKDFYSPEYLVYVPEKILKISKGNVLSFLKTESDYHPPIAPVENDDDLYQKDFQLLRSSFGEDLQKVVLISRESYEGFHHDKTIRRLLRKAFEFDAGWPYGLWLEGQGLIGSTPELLFEVRDQVLSTFALAGTARKGEEEVLLSSTKDRHEHNLVVKDITEKLSSFTTDLSVTETGLLPFKAMVHLKTDIKARVKDDLNFCELTSRMSPTAALGGYPKKEALNFLRGTSYAAKYPKRYFGSSFGIISQDFKEFLVAIRNVQWQGQRLFIECGGGVVPQSEYQKELDEVHLKRETVRKHYL